MSFFRGIDMLFDAFSLFVSVVVTGFFGVFGLARIPIDVLMTYLIDGARTSAVDL